MASHQLAIAKASFSAGLLRPDPRSVSKEDIANFHSLLNITILQCSPINVQKCKQWVLENIVQSTARCSAFGKYLTALTTSFTKSSNREPSIKRKRIHLLYILNDILYHAKYRINDASICGKLQPTLIALLGSAASFTDCPKHQRKIRNLLDLWQEWGYYSEDYINKLRETANVASENGEYLEAAISSTDSGEQSLASKASKSAFIMPAMHGDSLTPWFDLPAGNLMPHIIPNSTRPINPEIVKPLRFVAGPAEENLVTAVKALLDDVHAIYSVEPGQDESGVSDIDQLGQPIVIDELNGDIVDGEGYYGWSRIFCEKMKRRRKGLDQPAISDRDQRSQSRSISPRRKRRHSDSGDSDRSRRRRSYSHSGTASPDYDRRIERDDHSRSRSRSRKQDNGDHEFRNSSSGTMHPSTGNGNPSMPDNHVWPAAFTPQQTGYPNPPIVPQQQIPYQHGFNPAFPHPGLAQNQASMPWPPPPPPPQPNMLFNQGNPQWPPPPPPNPPSNFQQPQVNFPPNGPMGWQPSNQMHGSTGRGFGRGWNNNSYGGQGRGGRGNYRGRGWS